MKCPHCRADIPPHRRGPRGGQCSRCRRLFVSGRRVAYNTFSTEFLRARAARLSRRGALRLSSLQLQADAREQRPYPSVPRRPWWHVDDYDVDNPPLLPVAGAVAVVAVTAILAVFRWHWPGWALALLVFVGLPMIGPVVTFIGFFVHLLVQILVLAVRLPVGIVRALIPDRNKVVFTPSAFTAHARTVAPDLVDEHGMAPPPAPEPARFAVLCPDPAVAACLWANDVTDHLGALVVTAAEDVPARMPVLDLTDRTPADAPTELLTAVLRFGRTHHDAGPTGFLSEPVSG